MVYTPQSRVRRTYDDLHCISLNHTHRVEIVGDKPFRIATL